MPNVLSQMRLNRIPVKDFVPESSATAPTTPAPGQTYYDTALGKIRTYEAGAWKNLSDDTNTSYTAGTAAEVTAGSDNTLKVWSPSVFKAAVLAQLNKGAVGLGNVDNTADSAKPVSVAQAAAIALKADLASPTFTGDPKAPTPSPGDNDTSIATTAFVATALGGKANLVSPALTGNPTAPTPTTGTGIANKDYVDNSIQGLKSKPSVHVATTGNITLTGTQTVDGVALVAGDRVLVKDQTAAATNGIYVVASGAWTRATDADTWAELVSAFVFVEEGTSQQETGWVSSVNAGGTIGTTSVLWVQFSSAGLILAGTGLTKTGNTISIANDSVTTAMMADGSVELNTGTVTGILPVTKGGTGTTSYVDLAQALFVTKQFPVLVPALTAGTWATLHNHPTWDASNDITPLVTFTEVSTGEAVLLDTRFIVGLDKVEVKSDIAVAADTILAVVTTHQ